jgi:transposase
MRIFVRSEEERSVTDLGRASRAELIALVSALLGKVERLEARVAELEEENRRLRKGGGGKDVPAWVKPNRSEQQKQVRGRRDRAFVRRREAHPEEIQHHALERCPDCGHKLAGGWEHRRRQVIELVPPRVRVVEHVVMARWCGVCGKRQVPKLTAEVLGVQGKRRFGVSVQSLVAVLHGRYRVPMKEIRRLLAELCGLGVSEGEIVALLDGVVGAGEAELVRLQEAVRGSPVVCADETGWRQEGKNGFVWTFATPTVRYFVYRRTRSGTVAEEVMGEQFGGIVSCDCYAGYNRLEADKQRCWAHLLRDVHALQEEQADQPEVVAWGEAVKALYEQAKAMPAGTPPQRRRYRRHLEVRLDSLVRPIARKKRAPHHVLAERIRGHLLEWFVFVEHPEVPSTNNLAERSLRPAVIARKISGGTRSEKGSHTKMGLMSLLGTWTLRNEPLLPACRKLLLTGSPA